MMGLWRVLCGGEDTAQNRLAASPQRPLGNSAEASWLAAPVPSSEAGELGAQPNAPLTRLATEAGVAAFDAMQFKAGVVRVVKASVCVDTDTEMVPRDGAGQQHREVHLERPVASDKCTVYIIELEDVMSDLELFLVQYAGSNLQRKLEGMNAVGAAAAAAAAAATVIAV